MKNTRTPGALLDPEKDDGSMISIEECAKQMLERRTFRLNRRDSS